MRLGSLDKIPVPPLNSHTHTPLWEEKGGLVVLYYQRFKAGLWGRMGWACGDAGAAARTGCIDDEVYSELLMMMLITIFAGD